MTASPPDPVSLDARITALEQSNRRLRAWLIGTAAAVALLAVAIVVRDDAPPGEFFEVRAVRFTLIDGSKRTRGIWSAEDRALTKLALVDQEGRERLTHGLGNDEAWTSYVDRKGNKRLGLAVDRDDLPHVVLADEHARPRLHMAINPLGHPNMLLLADDGSYPAGIGIDDDGKAWHRPAAALQQPSGDGK